MPDGSDCSSQTDRFQLHRSTAPHDVHNGWGPSAISAPRLPNGSRNSCFQIKRVSGGLTRPARNSAPREGPFEGLQSSRPLRIAAGSRHRFAK